MFRASNCQLTRVVTFLLHCLLTSLRAVEIDQHYPAVSRTTCPTRMTVRECHQDLPRQSRGHQSATAATKFEGFAENEPKHRTLQMRVAKKPWYTKPLRLRASSRITFVTDGCFATPRKTSSIVTETHTTIKQTHDCLVYIVVGRMSTWRG